MDRKIVALLVAIAVVLATVGGGLAEGSSASDGPEDLRGTTSLTCTAQAGVLVGRIGVDPGPDFNPVTNVDQLDFTDANGLEDFPQDDTLTTGEFKLLNQHGFQLWTATDPTIDVVRAAAANPDLSPVYVYGVGGHVFFLPGGGATPMPRAVIDYNPDVQGLVGVVDTGLEHKPRFSDASVVDEGLDREIATDPAVAGHGTFIASLIRQIDGGPAVLATAARLGSHWVTDGTLEDAAAATSTPVSGTTAGWSVFAAIIRLADELAKTGTPLSISMGSEPCGMDPLLVSYAIDYWGNTVGGPMFASAGNGSSPGKTQPTLYPASDKDVVAVGAVDWHGNDADFSNASDVTAPGVCLIADRGVNNGGVHAWSGTSFAAPLVAAGYADYGAVGQPDTSVIDISKPGICTAAP
jgi:hypothetical protein